MAVWKRTRQEGKRLFRPCTRPSETKSKFQEIPHDIRKGISINKGKKRGDALWNFSAEAAEAETSRDVCLQSEIVRQNDGQIFRQTTIVFVRYIIDIFSPTQTWKCVNGSTWLIAAKMIENRTYRNTEIFENETGQINGTMWQLCPFCAHILSDICHDICTHYYQHAY